MQIALLPDFYTSSTECLAEPGANFQNRHKQRIIEQFLHREDGESTLDAADTCADCYRISAAFTTEDLEDLLWEAGKGRSTGTRIVIEVPAGERRRKTKRQGPKKRSGHTLTAEEVSYCRGTRWQEVAVVGIDLLAVDRMPTWLRGITVRVNDQLCRTALRRYARSRAYVLELR